MARERSEERRALTILWRIENITYWKLEFHGRSICSTTFRALCLDGTQFYLRVFPKGEEDDPDDDPPLQVQLGWHEEVIDYCIDCEWSLLDDVGSPLITETLRNQNTIDYGFLDMTDCPSHDEVFRTRKSSFLPHDTLTVRCRIWKSDEGLEHAEHISALTRINTAEKSFVWRIDKFSSLQLDQKVITRVEISHFSDFLLYFSLMGASLEDARVNFQITTRKTEILNLTVNLSILKKEKDVKCVEGICAFRDGIREQAWDLPKFVSRKEILESRSDWLCGDDITLRCKFTAVKKSFDGLIESSHCGPRNLTDIPRHNPCITRNVRTVSKQLISKRKSNSTAVLLDDLLTLYKDQTLIDFNLRSGDVSFPVHKNVLSARSPVFRAMFCGDMREVHSSFQDIPDVDAHTLNRMLTFLYTSTVDDLQWENVAKLYYAADKYEVLSLKQECTSLLQSGLSVSNVSDILELADTHQDQELTSFVHDFLLNHYDEIVLSDEWDKFVERNGSFAGKTMKEVYKKKLQK